MKLKLIARAILPGPPRGLPRPAGPGRLAKRSASVRPVGGQRGTEVVVHLHGGPARGREGVPVLSAGGRRDEDPGRRRHPRQGDAQDRRRLRRSGCMTSGSGRPPGLSELRTFSDRQPQGDDRGRSRTTTSTQAPADPVRLGRQRRGRSRGRGLLRVRGEEGGPDHGRGRGGPARDHDLRPLRRHHGREAVRAGLERRRRPDLAGRVRLGRGPERRDVHRPGPRIGLCRQRELQLYRLHVGNFPRPTATIPAGGKFGETVDVKLVGDVLGDRTIKVKLPAEQDRDFGILAKDDDKGRRLIPTPSGSPPSAT